ncbi:Oxygen sensor histidine kinase NreB [Aequorivita antarctica]|nr:Oxygen sensor histidine kinase NreB [Aequorivita antarctica]
MFFSGIVYSQRFNSLNDNKKLTDSIIQIIKNTKSDSVKSYYSFKVCDAYRRQGNNEKFREYLKIGTDAAKDYPYLQDISTYYKSLEYVLSGDTQNYANGIVSTLEKLEKYKFKESYIFQTVLINNLSVIKQLEEKDAEGLSLLIDSAIPLAIKADDKELLSNIYRMVATTLMNLGEFDKAKQYFKKSIYFIENVEKPSSFLLEAKLETYILNAQNLLYLNENMESKKWLDKAFKILYKYPDSNINNLYYAAEALYFFNLNEFNKALTSCENGITVCKKNDDQQSLNQLWFRKFLILNELKRYKEARTLMYEILEKGDPFEVEKKSYYKEMVKTLKGLGEYKEAIYYYDKYSFLNDSLNEVAAKKEILDLETKYNRVESQQRISELEVANKKAQLLAAKNSTYYLLFGFFSIILIFIIFQFWLNGKNKAKLINEKEKNYVQNLITIQKQKELEVMQATISGEEIERKRIAKDLHDGIGSSLSVLKMRLSNLKDQNANIPNNEIETISKLLSSSITELRRVAHNLVPESLLRLGLDAALRDLCFLLSSDSIEIFYHSNNIKPTISEKNELTIYRIIQELITNAIKHSKCGEIIVDCSQFEDTFFISVEDNGKGFVYDPLKDFQGMGLKNIKNRVSLLNGKMAIESETNSGATFYIELSI